MTYGTLARGAPRELQENVKYADWSRLRLHMASAVSDLCLVEGWG